MNFNKRKITQRIKQFATDLGFDAVGITEATFLSSDEQYLKQWLSEGYQAEMSYMERNIEKRLDASKLVKNAKSVIVVLKNYFPPKKQPKDVYQISKYAYGQDYHYVLKQDLYKLFEFIKTEIKDADGRVFVDSAPVLEKRLAQLAGLGWIGKNSLLLTKKGSFHFIGEIILNAELEYDTPFFNEYCGNCQRCIDACPTGAIVSAYVVDSNKCISYQTIEKKGEFPQNLNLDFANNIFGCDICQDVCPWNSKASPTDEQGFKLSDELLKMKNHDFENLTEQQFSKLFKKSAVSRTKYSGLMRNINYVAKQKKELDVSNKK